MTFFEPLFSGYNIAFLVIIFFGLPFFYCFEQCGGVELLMLFFVRI